MSQQREVELKAILLDQHANTTTPASFIIMAGVPMWQQQKRGGKCCGCCCDYRRAVIVLAIIRIAFIVLINMLSLASNGPDDWSFACVIMIVGILLNLCPLVGALTYNICLVAVDFVWCAGK